MDITQEILVMLLQFLPLTSNKNIIQANALRYDWNDLLSATECDYIIGNPPFVGHNVRSDSQKADMIDLFGAIQTGKSDYAISWFYCAAGYMEACSTIRAAFVATSSISQGESVGIIWRLLLDMGISIDFAWTSFIWNSEAADKAHVHVVVIGFSKNAVASRKLFHPDGVTETCAVINPYLMPAEEVIIERRTKPISAVPEIRVGSLPRSSAFTVTASDHAAFLQDPTIGPQWLKPYIGAEEFLNNKERYCLWLKGVSEDDIRASPRVAERVERVRQDRLSSAAAVTRRAAATPTLFAVDAQPESSYLLIPQVSSERRDYIPIGFMPPEIIASNLVFVVPDATLYHFGVLTSQFHNAWMRTVAGRLESRYRYGGDLVYNNFVWPDPNPAQKQAVEQAAQSVLDARAAHPGKSLADLYDPDKMPSDLLAAHKALDKAVEEAYGVDFNGDEEKIVAYLFRLYAKAVTPKKEVSHAQLIKREQ